MCSVFTTAYYETKVPFTFFLIMGTSYLGFVLLFLIDCCCCCFQCVSLTNNVIHNFTMTYNGLLVLIAIAIDYYPPDFVFIIAIMIPVMATYYFKFYENIDYYQVDYVINMQYFYIILYIIIYYYLNSYSYIYLSPIIGLFILTVIGLTVTAGVLFLLSFCICCPCWCYYFYHNHYICGDCGSGGGGGGFDGRRELGYPLPMG